MKKILILGHNGMLGNAAYLFFTKHGYDVETTDYRFPDREFLNVLANFSGDYIINCIGSIPQKTDIFDVNVDLPLFLSTLNVRVIHPATDCEGDDSPYGISKKYATDFLVENSPNTKIIKSSIIGIEKHTNYSLLSWALSKEDETLNGFTDAKWNGITTLTWVEIAHEIMKDWDGFKQMNIVYSECISKYELLNIIQEVFNTTYLVNPIHSGVGKNKCLEGGGEFPPIKDQLIHLKKFYRI